MQRNRPLYDISPSFSQRGVFMKWYCKRCRTFHDNDEMCPYIKIQLRTHPEWVGEAANFSVIAGEYHLISTQALDGVAQRVGSLMGKELTYEGTQQFARDIQVFKRLNEEAFVRCGAFSTPEAAKAYMEKATPGQLKTLLAKINGSGQEVDWLREQSGRLSSLMQKNDLLNKNAVGVDGVVYNRFTGSEITRVTIKTAQTRGGLNTNVQGIVKAIKLDRLQPNETVYGVEGTKTALMEKLTKEINYAQRCGDTQLVKKLQQAQKGLKVIENNTLEGVSKDAARMFNKIGAGNAVTQASASQVLSKAANGGIIGAAISLTVSGITNYVRYKNGELTKNETFREIGEDTAKGAIIGAGLSTVTIFLPAGPLGIIGGLAVGIYLNATCTNLLDEIFGKGAYGAILDASGYIYGTTYNLGEQLKEIEQNAKRTQQHLIYARIKQTEIEQGFDLFEKMKEG